jgi:glycosyltransferase involved in cell wall biosynthesis
VKIDERPLDLPSDKKIIILQGAGINVDRGAEEAVLAMKDVNNALLLIVGSGDVLGLLKEMVAKEDLGSKVIFTGKVPFERLQQYTQLASLGLTLDKPSNINYRLSLPNKIFDYLHAGVPVLASDLVELRKVIDEYQVGACISSHDPAVIAKTINSILSDENQLSIWKKNTKIAAAKLNWQNEEQQLISVYSKFL